MSGAQRLRVLHLGINTASTMSTAVESLTHIGVETRGLVRVSHQYTSDEHLEMLPGWVSRRHPIQWASSQFIRYHSVLSAISWADVLHTYFGTSMLPHGLDLAWARAVGKHGLVEYLGSDIRIAEIEENENPYFARYIPREYRSSLTLERSRAVQAQFARAGFECLTYASMLPFVQKDMYRRIHVIRQRIPLQMYVPRLPLHTNERPVVVHAPSNTGIKGTEFVQRAVEDLQSTRFEFRLVNNVSHENAVAQIAEADIFVDQLLLGDHGIAAVEAMALGKPVICYIKPKLRAQLPSELPIVDANPDNITDVLSELLADGELRHQLGRRGRAYVEKYHDPIGIARQLSGIYAGLAERN